MAGAEVATPAAYIGIGALIVSAFLCALYGLSVSARAFFPVEGSDNYTDGKKSDEGGWRMLVPLYVFTACQVILGVFPGPVLDFITKIVEGLI